ncbi:AAA family ATPase [Paraburkholderia ferrariae]|uniref:AAA family ATPase n=1 Tax=Paraburkholderia ferrariae TaxID=386056 RepID=A0ABU9RMK0_9BURK
MSAPPNVPGSIGAPDYADLVERHGNRREQRAAAEKRAEQARAKQGNSHAETNSVEIWKPDLFRMEDLMNAPPQCPKFIIDGLLPPGLTFIAGRPKQGKSLVCLGMSLAIANGTPFWGHDVQHGHVLYLDLESAAWRVHSRIEKIGVEVRTGISFCFEWMRGNRDALIALLDARPDIRLVVIDVWRKFALPQPRHVEQYEHEQEELQWLSKLGTERGISILCVGHTVKNPAMDSDVFVGIGGSSAITGNSDAVMLLRREGEDERVLYTQGRDLGEASWRLRLDDRLTFHCLGDASLCVTREQMDYLRAIAEGAWSQRMLADRMKVTRQAVSQMLDRLTTSGLIHSATGMTVLTLTGEQVLEAQNR